MDVIEESQYFEVLNNTRIRRVTYGYLLKVLQSAETPHYETRVGGHFSCPEIMFWINARNIKQKTISGSDSYMVTWFTERTVAQESNKGLRSTMMMA